MAAAAAVATTAATTTRMAAVEMANVTVMATGRLIAMVKVCLCWPLVGGWKAVTIL